MTTVAEDLQLEHEHALELAAAARRFWEQRFNEYRSKWRSFDPPEPGPDQSVIQWVSTRRENNVSASRAALLADEDLTEWRQRWQRDDTPA